MSSVLHVPSAPPLRLVPPEPEPLRTPRVGFRGVQAERVVLLLEHLERNGATPRCVLQATLGFERWTQDRVVAMAKKERLVEPVNGSYRITPEGRSLLQSPAPAQVIGPPPRRRSRPAPDVAAEVLPMEAPVVVPPVPPVPVDTLREARLAAHRAAMRMKCERWLLGVRPELQAALRDGAHFERLVEYAVLATEGL